MVKGLGPDLLLTSDVGGHRYKWKARLVRAESSIDIASRQLFVIAQVDDPYKDDGSNRPQLKIGQFVQAKIEGQLLKDVFVLPRDIISGESKLLIIDQDSRIKYREVEVLWRDKENVVLKSGLSTGDKIISTQMPYAVEGTLVKVLSAPDTPITAEPTKDK